MIRRPPRSTHCISSAASDVYKRQIIHGAQIGKNVMIGMNTVIMDDAVIGDECIVGALAFVKAKMEIPARSLVVGNPARIIKEVSDEMIEWLSLIHI